MPSWSSGAEALQAPLDPARKAVVVKRSGRPVPLPPGARLRSHDAGDPAPSPDRIAVQVVVALGPDNAQAIDGEAGAMVFELASHGIAPIEIDAPSMRGRRGRLADDASRVEGRCRSFDPGERREHGLSKAQPSFQAVSRFRWLSHVTLGDRLLIS